MSKSGLGAGDRSDRPVCLKMLSRACPCLSEEVVRSIEEKSHANIRAEDEIGKWELIVTLEYLPALGPHECDVTAAGYFPAGFLGLYPAGNNYLVSTNGRLLIRSNGITANVGILYREVFD